MICSLAMRVFNLLGIHGEQRISSLKRSSTLGLICLSAASFEGVCFNNCLSDHTFSSPCMPGVLAHGMFVHVGFRKRG
jgi:hypothetical protein